VEVSGLISYGASINDLARRGATYVDKIFKGAKPVLAPLPGARVGHYLEAGGQRPNDGRLALVEILSARTLRWRTFAGCPVTQRGWPAGSVVLVTLAAGLSPRQPAHPGPEVRGPPRACWRTASATLPGDRVDVRASAQLLEGQAAVQASGVVDVLGCVPGQEDLPRKR
jgi:hypothetical protein